MKLVTGLVLFLAGVALVLASAAPSRSGPPACAHPAAADVVSYNPQTYAAPAYGGTAPYLLLGQQQTGLAPADLKRMLELQESLLAEQQTTNRHLEVIAGKLGAPVALTAPKLDALTVAKRRCMNCHTEKSQKGGFILFSDDKQTAFKPLSLGEKTKIANRVRDGSMPPSGALSAEEKAALKW